MTAIHEFPFYTWAQYPILHLLCENQSTLLHEEAVHTTICNSIQVGNVVKKAPPFKHLHICDPNSNPSVTFREQPPNHSADTLQG